MILNWTKQPQTISPTPEGAGDAGPWELTRLVQGPHHHEEGRLAVSSTKPSVNGKAGKYGGWTKSTSQSGWMRTYAY